MSKIKHNRPVLQLSDNYRRELKAQSFARERAFGEASDTLRYNGMPPVNEAVRELLLAMFVAADEYFSALSGWLDSMSSNDTGVSRKQRNILENDLISSKNRLIESCLQLIFQAFREALEDEKRVAPWLNWLQKEAERTDSESLREVFEVGMKPAFEKFSAAIDRI